MQKFKVRIAQQPYPTGDGLMIALETSSDGGKTWGLATGSKIQTLKGHEYASCTLFYELQRMVELGYELVP